LCHLHAHPHGLVATVSPCRLAGRQPRPSARWLLSCLAASAPWTNDHRVSKIYNCTVVGRRIVYLYTVYMRILWRKKSKSKHSSMNVINQQVRDISDQDQHSALYTLSLHSTDDLYTWSLPNDLPIAYPRSLAILLSCCRTPYCTCRDAQAAGPSALFLLCPDTLPCRPPYSEFPIANHTAIVFLLMCSAI
jgi:hypothetical protein